MSQTKIELVMTMTSEPSGRVVFTLVRRLVAVANTTTAAAVAEHTQTLLHATGKM